MFQIILVEQEDETGSVGDTTQQEYCFPPVADVASEDLGEAVAPEEAAQHHAGLPLAPLELLRHADGADGHRHAGAVQEARPEQQHARPYPRHWSDGGGVEETFRGHKTT